MSRAFRVHPQNLDRRASIEVADTLDALMAELERANETLRNAGAWLSSMEGRTVSRFDLDVILADIEAALAGSGEEQA